MLLTKEFAKLFVVNLKLLNATSPYFYHIDPTSHKLSTNDSKYSKFFMHLRYALLCFMVFIMLRQIILYRSIFQNPEIFEGTLFCAAKITFLLTFYVYCSKRDQVVELFNAVVQFEHNLQTGRIIIRNTLVNYLTHKFLWYILWSNLGPLSGSPDLLYVPKRKYLVGIKLLQICAVQTSAVTSFFYTPRHWFQRCTPNAPGFAYLNECAKYFKNPHNDILLHKWSSRRYILGWCSSPHVFGSTEYNVNVLFCMFSALYCNSMLFTMLSYKRLG